VNDTEIRKVALVTGAGMGIGRGIALELAKAGYDIAVHCNSSTDGAVAVCREAESYGGRTAVIRGSLTDKAAVEAVFAEFDRNFDRLDLFVSNAGVTKTADFPELSEEDFDLMSDLDLKGSYYGIAEASKRLSEGGSIVVIASNNAHMQMPRAAVYASIKAGLIHLARHAAVELAYRKIRINVISPGWTDTGSPRLGKKEDTYYKVPLKRWVLPSEIGQAVLFLSSPYAASITGTELVMDGGATLMSDRPDRYHL